MMFARTFIAAAACASAGGFNIKDALASAAHPFWSSHEAQPQQGNQCFPMLAPGTLFGVSYTPSTAAPTDSLYEAFLSKGATLTQLSIPWDIIESTPGVVDVNTVAAALQGVFQRGTTPILNIAAVDTNRASVPSDLVDPNNPGRLAQNLTWASPIVVYRYALAIQAIAPLAQYYGAFYFGLGNEVDVNMMDNPDLAGTFPAFVSVATNFIKNITKSGLAVGVTLTVAGLSSMSSSPPLWLNQTLAMTDATPLTYYPMYPNMSVIKNNTTITNEVFSALSILPSDACVVFQEFGFPAGYNNASSTDNSSLTAQNDFFSFAVTTLLPSVNASMAGGGRLRALSLFQLVDMPAETCLNLTKYYNTSQPAFIEYLCTLGVVYENATVKPAYNTLLEYF
jgi:hypothetical protein